MRHVFQPWATIVARGLPFRITKQAVVDRRVSCAGADGKGEETEMTEFFSNYGLWIALAGVFFAMHWFGMGCCGRGGHRHESKPKEGTPDEHASTSTPSAATGETPATRASRGCH